eukprot:3852209-Pyramimonas_sp.AAC.1
MPVAVECDNICASDSSGEASQSSLPRQASPKAPARERVEGAGWTCSTEAMGQKCADLSLE